MKAIELASPGNFRRIEIDIPDPPADGQALVRTHAMGICGTDVSCYLGKFPFFDYPRIPGHELGVEVVAVGAGVDRVKVGDRCSVEPYLNCGACYPCRKGNPNCCVNLKVIGVMTNGGLCDQFLLPASKLHSSAQLRFDQLALVETLAIGCHAINRAAPELMPTNDSRNRTSCEQVLIIGAGPIGLATLEFARLTTATISMMDISESRLQLCRDHYSIENTIVFTDLENATQQMTEITSGDRYQVVIDATGNSQSMSEALNYVAATGTLVYVGITTMDITFSHPKLHRPELTIKSSRNALPADFTRIIELIENGTIDTGPWVTHRTTFDDVIKDFPEFIQPDSGVVKAVIDVQ